MPIKHSKDMSQCVAWNDFYTDYFPGHYYRVCLWKDRRAMLDNTLHNDEEGSDEDCGGITCHAPYTARIGNDGRSMNRAPKRLGEIHFIQDDWNLEVVAHECFHASNHICKILNINPQTEILFEERAAYIHGELVDEVYGWLWRTDPPHRCGMLRSLARWAKRISGS